MFVTLEEAKGYLRVDSSDEDELILRLMETSDRLILDVTRRTPAGLKRHEAVVRTAELYAIAYLYEHREEADHKAMTETLKYLLFGIRKEIF
jgi:uncharacterized phage protein (predicted DNA packaging)